MIHHERLGNQHLLKPFAGSAAELVAWMGAVQAQEYQHARWGLGLRLAGDATASAIEAEISAGRILRTHVLRPTWHFVAAGDIRWMLALTGPRVHARMAPYDRQLALDAKTKTRATALFERALGDGACLTRAELGQVLRRARIHVTPTLLAHMAMHAELEGVICSGPRRDGVSTYSLVSTYAPTGTLVDRDEALGELARRFLQSHGPATMRDFVWWSGLTTPDATRGAQIAGAAAMTVNGRVYWTMDRDRPGRVRARTHRSIHLLPIYDEYLVAYRDREAVPHARTTIVRNGRVVGFQHALLIDGQVAGTWRTSSRRPGEVDVAPVRRLTAAEHKAVGDVSRRYSRFVTALY